MPPDPSPRPAPRRGRARADSSPRVRALRAWCLYQVRYLGFRAEKLAEALNVSRRAMYYWIGSAAHYPGADTRAGLERLCVALFPAA